MRLDVGCGPDPTGDVNVDRYRTSQTGSGTMRSKADIIADAQHLPFRSKSFDEVYASHVIEHVEHPSLALREWERIARHKIIVRTPTRWSSKDPYHKWAVTRTWLQKHGFKTDITRRSPIVSIPLLPFRLMLDAETTAVKILGPALEPPRLPLTVSELADLWP